MANGLIPPGTLGSRLKASRKRRPKLQDLRPTNRAEDTTSLFKSAGVQPAGKRASDDPAFRAAVRAPDFSPAPKEQIFGAAPAIPGIPQVTPGEFREDPVGKALESAFFTSRAVQDRLLPQFLDTSKPRALPQLEEFIPESVADKPERVSLEQAIKRFAPGATESAFRDIGQREPPDFIRTETTPEARFTAGPGAESFRPAFKGTAAITPDVLNSPQFQAFKADLEKATGEQSAAIADEFARRGILSSGATKEKFGELGEASSRAIAKVLGDIAQPLLTTSTLQQAIGEPIRETEFGERGALTRLGAGERAAERATGFGERETRAGEARRFAEASRKTGFGEREAERGTGFDLTQQEREERGRSEALRRGLGIAGGAQAEEQTFENLLAGLSRDERARIQEFAGKASELPFRQEQAGLDFQRQLQNLISGLLTGGQVSTGSLVQQQRTQEQSRQAELDREQRRRAQQQNLLSSAISSGLELL